MRFCYFDVTNIRNTNRVDSPEFYRCNAILGLADDGSEVVHEIKFSIAHSGPTHDTLDTVREKILLECVRLLKEGANFLDGRTLQSLHDLSDAETVRSRNAITLS